MFRSREYVTSLETSDRRAVAVRSKALSFGLLGGAAARPGKPRSRGLPQSRDSKRRFRNTQRARSSGLFPWDNVLSVIETACHLPRVQLSFGQAANAQREMWHDEEIRALFASPHGCKSSIRRSEQVCSSPGRNSGSPHRPPFRHETGGNLPIVAGRCSQDRWHLGIRHQCSPATKTEEQERCSIHSSAHGARTYRTDQICLWPKGRRHLRALFAE